MAKARSSWRGEPRGSQAGEANWRWGYVAVLLSMTGFGEARTQSAELTVAVELRSVNNRYLKINVRAGEGYAALEPKLESAVREHVRRGTVQVDVRIRRATSADDYRLNLTVLQSYVGQLAGLTGASGGEALPLAHSLPALLALPGVVEETGTPAGDAEQVWPTVERTLQQALQKFAQMRRDEGAAMRRDLDENCALILRELALVARRAPLVVEAYRTRLSDRLNQLLAEHEVQVQAADIVREVGLFAERGDISEEIVRLRSHVEQFSAALAEPESSGRKLDFVTQEMFRETNTIGSKANDAEIARHVIELKAAVERLREMIQNVE